MTRHVALPRAANVGGSNLPMPELERNAADPGLASARTYIASERLALGRREIYVAYCGRLRGRSKLRIPAAQAGTARNMNTAAKLAELAKEVA